MGRVNPSMPPMRHDDDVDVPGGRSTNCSPADVVCPDAAPAGGQVHVVVVIVLTMIMTLLVVRSLSLLSLLSL